MAVVSLGEILFDRFGNLAKPGGAPANAAYHVAALGESAAIVSRIGTDSAGQELTAWLRSGRIETGLLQSDRVHPTGSVTVLPGPRYEIECLSAWDFLEFDEKARAAVERAGAVVFGTLAQRHPVSRRSIRALVETACAARVPVVCDLNLRGPFYDEETVLWSMRNCSVLKLNREELDVLSGMLGATGATEDLFSGLMREFGIARGAMTDGGNGALIYEDGRISRHSAEFSPVAADTVGVGDAFTAVLAVAMSRGVPLSEAAAPAAALCAFVVSTSGAAPDIPHELVAKINAMLGV